MHLVKHLLRVGLILLTVAIVCAFCACSMERFSLLGTWEITSGSTTSSIREIQFDSKKTGRLKDADGYHDFTYSIKDTVISFEIAYEEDNVVHTQAEYYVDETELGLRWMDGAISKYKRVGYLDNNKVPSVSTPNSDKNAKPNNKDIVGMWEGKGTILDHDTRFNPVQLTLLSNGTGSIKLGSVPFEVRYSCEDGNVELTVYAGEYVEAFFGTCKIEKEDNVQVLTFRWEDGQTWVFVK